MSAFIGRRAELAVLRAGLADARAGRPRVAMIEGPSGIGKTALLETLLDGTVDDGQVVVLRASGDQNERLFAYGVLGQLARSAGTLAAQRFCAQDPVPPGSAERLVDPITMGTRCLEFLNSLAGAVVVLAVDDAHWADRQSLQALVFALRRLVADRVFAVFGVRTDGVVQLPDSLTRLIGGHLGLVIRLGGFDEDDLRELAGAVGVDGLSAPAARRLRLGTNGNPLHARALLEEFPVADWPVTRQDESLLPPPRSFRHLVGERYAACRPATQEFLDAVAVLGLHAPVSEAAALAGTADVVPAIDEATAHDLLTVRQDQGPWSVAFRHPLVRAALYDALGPARRHALHRAAAAVVPDDAAILRHRVAAATGPDEALAADLTAYAERAQRRFDWKNAAVHLVSASRLSTEPSRARSRVLWALVWTLLRGDAAGAADLADEVAAYPAGPLRDLVLGGMAMAAEDPVRAGGLLDRAWRAVGHEAADRARTVDSDPASLDTTAAVAVMQAIHHYGRLDAAGTVAWCERALAAGDIGTGLETSIHEVAVTYLVHGLGYAGRVDESLAAARAPEALRLWLNPRSARAVLHLIDDEFDSAAALLTSVVGTATRLGILNTAAFSYAYLARTQWMTGDWDEALVSADRAVAINLESDFGFLRSAVVGIAVLVPAARGDWATAESYLRLLPRSHVRYERSVMALGMARARLGEARGRPADVLAALDPVRAFPLRDAADEPGFWAWSDLYADALVAVGRIDEADEFLVAHERRADERRRHSAQARLARARGRVELAAARPEAARAAFGRALDLISAVPAPFERAKIEFAAGHAMRRLGRRRYAVELLMAARETFGRLGATPYADRCDAELAEAGLAAARPGSPRFDLTSQEHVVARLAADGLSNRQIAADLVVSIKTVEYHLRNVFAKLGVTSRRQLADRLGPGFVAPS
ncbi:AAA family ATPase [Nakamurella sp.]|uniref:helix-turn-helix transcriptional regulator n=1 Tax=Nakamurella sp. TaxID=1869182 RepID=UPI003783D378